MTRHYCCYFDHRYLPRGLAMIRSLRRFESASPVWVLCLNDECYELLVRLAEPGVRPIRLSELEAGDAELARARTTRSLVEYYFTLTPSLVLFLLDRVEAEDSVTYVDGDLLFYSSPLVLHEELGAGSVSIIPHRFPDRLRHLERYGVYNVGWLTFRNDAAARAVAGWWRARCNEWCHDFVESDRFADQKYLDRFESQFPGVVVLRNPGANLAPWNLARHTLSWREGALLVDGGSPLVFFHFHGLRTYGKRLYVARHFPYRAPFGGLVRHRLYHPYIALLESIGAEVARLGATQAQVLSRDAAVNRSLLARAKASIQRLLQNLPALVRGQFVVYWSGRAL